MGRENLAGIIGGDPGVAHDSLGDASLLLDSAKAEGVVTLVSRRLGAMSSIDPALQMVFAAPARDLAVTAMFLEAECRRVLAVLGEAGIPVLLLKGSALAYWLYPLPYLRDCSDIDLLFATREDAERAAVCLSDHRYGLEYPAADLAYEMPCRLQGDGVQKVELDMHWRLANSPLFADTFTFQELHARSIAIPQLGENARGLSPPDALAHASIHRAINLFFDGAGDRLKWLYDIHLLAKCLDSQAWVAFNELCIERGLCGVCHDGIAAAASVFDTPLSPGTLDVIADGRHGESLDVERLRSWTYLHYRNLAALPGARTRIRWAWQQVFLPHSRMRSLYGDETDALWLLHWRRLGRASRHLAAWIRSRIGFKRPVR